jgi:hypothetical protein
MREGNRRSCSKQFYGYGRVELIVRMNRGGTPFFHLIAPPELCPW